MKSKKLLISLAVVLAHTATLQAQDIWDGSTAAQFAAGTGTADDPYQISNGEELALMANYSDKHFVLTNDIYLNSFDEFETITYNIWTPIADFSGTLNGYGYTIYGLYFFDIWVKSIGLFNTLSGEIENLGIKKHSICGNSYVGAIAGTNNGTIINCHIYGGQVTGNESIGGIVGLNNGKIINCYNASVVGDYNSISVGGIAGLNNGNNCLIVNCYNVDIVNGSSSIGGICGMSNNDDNSIVNCFYLGNDDNSLLAVGSLWGNVEIPSSTSAQFASGEIAYKLQQGTADYTGDSWSQTIGTDANPKLSVGTATNHVYKVEFVYANTTLLTKYANDGSYDLPTAGDLGISIEPQYRYSGGDIITGQYIVGGDDVTIVVSAAGSNALDTAPAPVFRAFGANGAIITTGANTAVEVFDISGRCLYTGTDSRIAAATGVYIAKCGSTTVKVVVK